MYVQTGTSVIFEWCIKTTERCIKIVPRHHNFIRCIVYLNHSITTIGKLRHILFLNTNVGMRCHFLHLKCYHISLGLPVLNRIYTACDIVLTACDIVNACC